MLSVHLPSTHPRLPKQGQLRTAGKGIMLEEHSKFAAPWFEVHQLLCTNKEMFSE
jgi:hypothetical protein